MKARLPATWWKGRGTEGRAQRRLSDGSLHRRGKDGKAGGPCAHSGASAADWDGRLGPCSSNWPISMPARFSDSDKRSAPAGAVEGGRKAKREARHRG